MMKKDKLVLMSVRINGDLMNLSPDVQKSNMTFLTHISNADNPKLHLFVASNKWRELIIQLVDSDSLKGIFPMLCKFEQIKVCLMEKPTQSVIHFLCKLYPQKAASIRKAYMTGKDVGGIINEQQ